MTTTHGSMRMEGRHLTGWAVGTAVATAVLFAVGVTVLGIVGFDADDEAFTTGTTAVVSVGLFGGMLASVAAFVTAVVARMRHEHSAWLWLPLLLAPVLLISFPLWFE